MSAEFPSKPLRWLGDSRRRLSSFPSAARQRAGFELWEVQQGKEPSDWKPMTSIGSGVSEIRVHAAGEYRVLYVAKFDNAVYVLHAFAKRTRRTSNLDMSVAAVRYKALLAERGKG
jgi:phage-related protein